MVAINFNVNGKFFNKVADKFINLRIKDNLFMNREYSATFESLEDAREFVKELSADLEEVERLYNANKPKVK